MCLRTFDLLFKVNGITEPEDVTMTPADIDTKDRSFVLTGVMDWEKYHNSMCE